MKVVRRSSRLNVYIVLANGFFSLVRDVPIWSQKLVSRFHFQAFTLRNSTMREQKGNHHVNTFVRLVHESIMTNTNANGYFWDHTSLRKRRSDDISESTNDTNTNDSYSSISVPSGHTWQQAFKRLRVQEELPDEIVAPGYETPPPFTNAYQSTNSVLGALHRQRRLREQERQRGEQVQYPPPLSAVPYNYPDEPMSISPQKQGHLQAFLQTPERRQVVSNNHINKVVHLPSDTKLG
jgi:hypothetical protein